MPATPQSAIDLAFATFSESPIAVKNIIPAMTKQITAITVNTIQTALTIDCPKLEILKLLEVSSANALAGNINNPIIIIFSNLFIFRLSGPASAGPEILKTILRHQIPMLLLPS